MAQPAPIKVDPKIYDAYAGQYELEPGTPAPGLRIAIRRDGDRLIAQAASQGFFGIEIKPTSETEFSCMIARVTFVKDSGGRVTGLVAHHNGMDLPARKVE
jgi:hypothetical protein